MELSARTTALIGVLVAWLITAVFVHLAASPLVSGKQRYGQALLATGLGSLLAGLVLVGLGFGTLAVVLALAAWALVLAAVYRTSWLKGALIGVVAWLIWTLVQWLLLAVLSGN